MPTTLELAGVEKPKHVQFNSLLPLLGGDESAYGTIYGAYLHLQRSIRTDRFKLIVYPKANVVRLYDVQNDPLERNDLAGDAKHGKTVQALFRDLKSLQQQLNDSLDLGPLKRYRDS
jgi:choline-sulfatase